MDEAAKSIDDASRSIEATFNAEHTVVFEVSGAGPADITYSSDAAGSSSQAGGSTLPWSKTVKAKGLTAGMSVLAQNGINAKGGEIKCKITVDGKVVKQGSASGKAAIVTCVAGN